MAFEIELKAWVNDYEAVKNRLSKCTEFECQYNKEDVYWFPIKADSIFPKSGLRIRTEKIQDIQKKIILVTYKSKEMREKIEVNREHEFTVSGADDNAALEAFEGLLRAFGLAPGHTKKKSGFSFRTGDITAELSLVEKLGWFLELEIIAEDACEETVKNARKKLFALLKTTGVDESNIETRYYSEMLCGM
jgi:adenylate cyclase class 2